MSNKDLNRKDREGHKENRSIFALFARLAVRLTEIEDAWFDFEKALVLQ
jgi:hypothetical protein